MGSIIILGVVAGLAALARAVVGAEIVGIPIWAWAIIAVLLFVGEDLSSVLARIGPRRPASPSLEELELKMEETRRERQMTLLEEAHMEAKAQTALLKEIKGAVAEFTTNRQDTRGAAIDDEIWKQTGILEDIKTELEEFNRRSDEGDHGDAP